MRTTLRVMAVAAIAATAISAEAGTRGHDAVRRTAPRMARCWRTATPAAATCARDIPTADGFTAKLEAARSGQPTLRSAYKLTTSGSATQTVAIVDAFDAPTAEANLAAYRTQYGLSACTTANGCFRKVDQNGGTNYPRKNTGWAQEISLDLDMVSAICRTATSCSSRRRRIHSRTSARRKTARPPWARR